jgi:hypothetical protein
MDIRTIKNDREKFWTNHAKLKMLQYGISPVAVKKVLNHPWRVVEGIAPETIAAMIRKDSKKTQKELWVMYQKRKSHSPAYLSSVEQAGGAEKLKSKGPRSRIRIISAWIYPGVSPKGKEIFIPDDVWKELDL